MITKLNNVIDIAMLATVTGGDGPGIKVPTVPFALPGQDVKQICETAKGTWAGIPTNVVGKWSSTACVDAKTGKQWGNWTVTQDQPK